jgi:hypothetical protein
LVFASIPFLGQFLETLKAGDVEAKFRNLSFPDQVLTFISVLATKRQLTFYMPRKGKEQQLGTVGNYLIDEMLHKNRRRTIREIKKWLIAENDYLKWFASEVIGYFGIIELAEELKPHYKALEYDVDWEDWQLNCLWAHSKLKDNYKEFVRFLTETDSTANQDWALDVFIQMREEGETMPQSTEITRLLNKMIGNDNLDDAIKNKANEIIIQESKVSEN